MYIASMKILSEKGRKYFGKNSKLVEWLIVIGLILPTIIMLSK